MTVQTKSSPPNAEQRTQSLLELYTRSIPWSVFAIVALIASVVGALGIAYGDLELKVFAFAGIIGFVVVMAIYQKPELGAYLLTIMVFTNASDLMTTQGLPSVNKPLVAVIGVSILANTFLQTGKFKLPTMGRAEWTLLLFYGVVVASSLVSSDFGDALNVIIDVTKDILIGIIIFVTLDTREKWETCLRVFLATMTIVGGLGVFKMISGTEQTFFGLAQLSIIGQLDASGTLRYGGPIGESNMWGQVLAASVPLALYQLRYEKNSRRKVLALAASLVLLLAVIFTNSRGAFLAMGLILPLIAIEMKIRPVQMMIGALVIALMFMLLPSNYAERLFSIKAIFQTNNDEYALYQDSSFVSRQNQMKAGMAMFWDHPFLGVGFGNYSAHYWKYASELGLVNSTYRAGTQGPKNPHSLYVEILSEMGLAGFFTFSFFFFSLFISLWQAYKKYDDYHIHTSWTSWTIALIFSLTTFLISGMFLHGLLFRFIWVLIGFAMAAVAINRQILQTMRQKNQLQWQEQEV
ncbi:MAG: O-antigen ligase family protein [Anaerolineales bacterium]|nr:O-antigen ligase family protein [Anaerolineales bacterium]